MTKRGSSRPHLLTGQITLSSKHKTFMYIMYSFKAKLRKANTDTEMRHRDETEMISLYTCRHKTWERLWFILDFFCSSRIKNDINAHQQASVLQGSFLCRYQTGWETHTWFCHPSPLLFAQSALTLRCTLIEYGEPWDWQRQRWERTFETEILVIRFWWKGGTKKINQLTNQEHFN